MKPLRARQSSRPPPHLLNITANEFEDPIRAAALLIEFFEHQSYFRNFATKLIKVAIGEFGDGWDIRRLAALMLENQVLKVPDKNIDEWDFLLTRLNLKSKTGINITINESILKEGYSTTNLRRFIPELRQRLERLIRIHNSIQENRTSKSALLAFIRLSRKDCRLSLARYLFQPEEIVDRILEQVKLSKGLPDLDPFQPAFIQDEIDHVMDDLPDFEAKILQSLRDKAGIYWVADSTSSEINSLIEYPLTTVALVIKPPGSDMEFEIKRVGRKGKQPLNVVFRRNGRMVPPPHRFDGGIRQRMVRWEAEMAAKFSCIYRLIHKAEAPISTIVSRFSVYNVPVRDGEVRLLDYFTDARIFGSRFSKMRKAMQLSVDSFNIEERFLPVDLPGDMGLTIRFLMHITPMQVILCGTSSFRLDRLAAYLSNRGPEIYFNEGLNTEYKNLDARLLADEILDEILCVYHPPDVAYRSHKQYLKAAFAVSENRRQANQNYLSVMKEFGSIRGTLLALRGHSMGESFVGRNVGLRSVWKDGQWRIKIIFMDHDNMNLINQASGDHQALGSLSGMDADDVFIWGTWSDESYITGAVDYLNRIYRVGDEVGTQGKDSFHKSMATAYKQTQKEIELNPKLQSFFYQSFLERIRDWDRIAAGYSKARQNPEMLKDWKESMKDYLTEKGYDEKAVLDHLAAVEMHGHFLERYSFLY